MDLIRINGQKMAFRVDGDRAPGRPWLVFVHGLGHDHSMWDDQVAVFARGCNVLRYDLRGHGRSTSSPGDVTIDDLAADLKALLDLLNLKRCHLIGACLGGMVAQVTALRAPLRFASVTLAATVARCSTHLRSQLEARITAARSPLGMNAVIDMTLATWFTAAFFAVRANDIARAVKILRRTSNSGYIACIRAMLNADLTPRLVALDCPALVLVGDSDRFTPPTASEELARLLPQAHLQRLEGAAHLGNVEQAEAFNEALRGHLTSGL